MKDKDSQAVACNGVPIFDGYGGILSTDDAVRLEGMWEKSENYKDSHSTVLNNSSEVSLGQQVHSVAASAAASQLTSSAKIKMNMNTSGFSVPGLTGTWHAIDHMEVDGHNFWLMDHDTGGNDASCIIVNDQGILSLTRVLHGFNEHTVGLLRQELMPVDRMPDDSISVEEMKSYGYAWGGMLPLKEAAAIELWDKQACPIYRLYEDDSEGMVMEGDEFQDHAEIGGIFGVEKVDWLCLLEKETIGKESAKILDTQQVSIDDRIQSASTRAVGSQHSKNVKAKEHEPEI